MNLTEELDRSFGSGPEHRPIEDRLVAGRRLIRHRRTTASAAALAVIAVVASGVALTGADDPSSDPGIAEPPSEEPSDDGFRLGRGERIGLTPDGTLLVRDGVEVLEEVENPLGYSPPDHSLGVVYRFESTTYWALTTIEPTGNHFAATTATDGAGKSFPTFQYWLDDRVALQQGDKEMLALVSFGEGETLLPRDGVEILQQTGDVELPANFAGPNDKTAVAEVTYRGERWYVLARQVDGSPPEYFPSAAAVTGPTLEEFLDYAADAYAAEEGLR